MGPLVDMFVSREGDDEHVAHRLGLLEVAEVPDVEQVEDPVAVHDLPPLAAEAGKGGGELREGLDLVAGEHAAFLFSLSDGPREVPALYPTGQSH